MSDPQIFKNRYAVVKWLLDNGYKVKKSKVYNDAEAGLLKMERDGKVTIESVRRYIDHPEAGISEDLETAQAGDDMEIKGYHRRTAIAKMQIAELDAQKKRFDLDKEQGLHIARADLEMEMATRAAVFDQALSSLVRVRADEWIHMAGGNINRVADVKAVIINEISELLSRYVSTDTFQVMFDIEEGSIVDG